MDERAEYSPEIETPYVRANDGFWDFTELPKEVRLRLAHEEKERRAERAEYHEKLE